MPSAPGCLYHTHLQYPSIPNQLLSQPNPLSPTVGRMCSIAYLSGDMATQALAHMYL